MWPMVNPTSNDRMGPVLKSLTKSGSADGTNIYISVHRWSKCDKVPCLGAQAGVRTRNVIIAAQWSDSLSNALTQPHITSAILFSLQIWAVNIWILCLYRPLSIYRSFCLFGACWHTDNAIRMKRPCTSSVTYLYITSDLHIFRTNMHWP